MTNGREKPLRVDVECLSDLPGVEMTAATFPDTLEETWPPCFSIKVFKVSLSTLPSRKKLTPLRERLTVPGSALTSDLTPLAWPLAWGLLMLFSILGMIRSRTFPPYILRKEWAFLSSCISRNINAANHNIIARTFLLTSGISNGFLAGVRVVYWHLVHSDMFPMHW